MVNADLDLGGAELLFWRAEELTCKVDLHTETEQEVKDRIHWTGSTEPGPGAGWGGTGGQSQPYIVLTGDITFLEAQQLHMSD
ncbi:hypothetical protein INR49_009588, partial [Caranx melampygus]